MSLAGVASCSPQPKSMTRECGGRSKAAPGRRGHQWLLHFTGERNTSSIQTHLTRIECVVSDRRDGDLLLGAQAMAAMPPALATPWRDVNGARRSVAPAAATGTRPRA